MTKEELAQNVQEFILKGGKVTECEEGETLQAYGIANCRCGCSGDYTEHSMRAGESGRCSSVVVR